ncbi:MULTISPECIES: BON domain-containing protein [Oxalobacteraceae]|uniref:BON domain-containing protein n=1 Tax=Herminiimonas sp. Marseille-P9896 TaxID=2742211 RepID=UPI001589C29C|nr:MULTISPECIES: BON domain-containing protein [Oxalobacteraceae]
MKTLSNNSKVAIAASLLTVLFAAGCERRTPPEESSSTPTPTAPSESPAAAGVTPPTPVPETAPAAPGAPADANAGKSAGQIVDDTVITTKVKSALLADSDVKGLDVVVETSKGIVSLSGAVNNQTQIDRAAKITGEVEGVNSVLNNLTIKKQ